MTGWLRVDQAARIILAGGVVAYPTEAVYGIGCLPDCPDALERVLQIKRRSRRKGMIVVAADISQLDSLAALPEGPIGERMRASWPGPVTWIVPAGPAASPLLTGGRDTIAVRVSAHPIVRRLCQRTGSALVSTSANLSGNAPARTVQTVRQRFGQTLDFVLGGPLGGSVRPTEIRDAATGRVLREA